MIRLYGRNYKRVPQGERSFWSDIEAWTAERIRATGQVPEFINVTSQSKEKSFRSLSPMLMGPVECYREGNRMITAVSVEVAWQYSKVFSHIWDGKRLVDVSQKFIAQDRDGRLRPSKEWFRWRDAAFGNPFFVHTHPEFSKHKKFVRYPFRKGPKGRQSRVTFWYWNGEIMDAVRARKEIYSTLYKRFLLKNPNFQCLRKMVRQGKDIRIFDKDGYDWVALKMTPAECLKNRHSFGHGMVIAFLLQGIDPCKLPTN